MGSMFFHDEHDLLRILVVGFCAYVGLVIFLRATGRRTLSKMNAFDLVVTVALGSTLATVLLNRDVSLAEGLVAFLLLCVLQYLVAWSSVRSKWFRDLVKAEPALLFFRGRFMRNRLLEERVTEEEVFAALRAEGIGDLSSVQAVVPETDGSMSVVSTPEQGGTALQPLQRGQFKE